MGYVYDQELSKLLAARGIGCAWPDSVGEWKIIDIFYETLIENLYRDLDLVTRVECNRFHSIHISYIEARFYRRTWGIHTGLKILFSRILPCFIAGETKHFLHSRRTDNSWVSADFADRYNSPDVEALFQEMEPHLLRHGLIRPSQEGLAQRLPSNFHIPTILGDPPYSVFDALFHIDV